MKDVVADRALVACCGLYCGACKKYLRGSCPGCRENHKASWCAVRTCCLEKKIASCADCQEFANPRDCAKFNSFISRVIGFVLRSDRAKCIDAIKKQGYEAFAAEMASKRLQSLRR
jgi:hypothetical protein